MPYTAIPIPELAQSLHAQYKEQLITSYVKIIESNLNYFKKEGFFDPSIKIKEVNLVKKISPAIYCSYFTMLSGIRSHDSQQINHALDILRRIKDVNYKEIQVGHIQSDFWEEKIISQYEKKLVNQKRIKFNKILEEELKEHKEHISKALKIIKESDPFFYQEIEEYVAKIKLHRGEVVVGLTSPLFHGCVYISLPPKNVDPILYYIEHLVHETSHLHLNTMLSRDKMILNSPDEKYDAPIRTDKRPLLGVFHATFVLSRIVRIFNFLITKNLKNTEEAKKLRLELTYKFIKGYYTLKEHAHLTKGGGEIFNSLLNTAFEGKI